MLTFAGMTTTVHTIEIADLSIGYKTRNGAKTIGHRMSATVRGGELTCLLGRNGAGKSTLLRTMAGFLPKLSGAVSIDGKDMSEYSAAKMARTVSIVLTEKPDTGNMTVAELVALGRSPYTGFWGRCSDDDRRVAYRAMATVGIGELARRRVASLSDGERQKAMIAKALAQQTPVMLLDEPTAFLDFTSKAEVMRLLRQISHDTGKIVFMSTHDLDLALQAADTLWLMDNGGKLATGAPEDLALDGRLEAFFGHGDIVFDTATGLFVMNHATTTAITVGGLRDRRYDMLCKALRRNGIEPADPCGATPEVEVAEGGYTITTGNGLQHAATIAEVMRALCRNRQQQ